MLDDRKTAILRAVIEEYIESAQPVGSMHIARSARVNVSAATVRNEMAVLEQDGYLHQPHTSAGRVPTDKGYRFFVDSLTGPGVLDAQGVVKVRDFFESSHGALEQLLSDTTTLLSSLTNYAAVVIRPTAELSIVRSVQLVQLSSHTAMVVAVLANGTVESETLELTDQVCDAHVLAAGAHLARHAVGRTLANLVSLPPSGDVINDALVSSAAMALIGRGRHDAEQAFVGGASRVAQIFDVVEVVRNVLHTLEHQAVVVALVRDVLERGLTVAIGAEHGVEPLSSCSVVVKPYLVDGEAVGTIGVLGPTRMNYPQALAAVETVSVRLGRTLSEG